MRKILLLFFTVFGIFQTINSQTFHYQITPIEAVDRTNLEISLSLMSDEPVNIKLPRDCFGSPNLQRFVTSFAGEDGTTVKDGKEPEERFVSPDSKGEIHIKYLLSFDPQVLADTTYSPNVGEGFYHVAGCQWMLRIGDPEQKHRYIIEQKNVSNDWEIYSSLTANPAIFDKVVSYRELMTTAIGGAKQGFSEFSIRQKPVSVFIEGNFQIPKNELVAAIRKIVTLQRERFNDFGQEFYHVVVLPRENNVAGLRIENLFVCFLKSDVTRDQLYVLLSHEMLHNWMTDELIKPEKGELSFRYQWFYEGINDYFARKILLDAGIITKEKFVELVNRDIINIADNPNKNITYQELVDAANNGKYGQALNKLSYYRGALIGLNWDAGISKKFKGKSLADLIKEVHQIAVKDGKPLIEKDFFELVQTKYGIDARADFERYIIRGETISVDQNALGNRYKLREKSVPSFDPGFSINESRQADKIIGVKNDAAAYRAGLRDGMELTDMKNYNRFSNAWDWTKPFSVTVKENYKSREVSYFPNGVPHKLLLFRATGKKNK